MLMNDHHGDDYETAAAVASSSEDGLSRRRGIVAAPSSLSLTSLSPLLSLSTSSSSSQQQQWMTQKQQHSYKDNEGGRRKWMPSSFRQQHLFQLSTRIRPLLAIAALAMTIIIAANYGIMTNNDGFQSSILPSMSSSYFRCSSFLRSFSNQEESQLNIILMASHLRHGPDGQLRLRIIEHNLRLLSEGEKDGGSQLINTKPLKSILIFSIDTESSKSDILEMVNGWRSQMDPHLAYDLISKIQFVPNNAIMVDASKWMAALTENDNELLDEIRNTNATVMLMNDSFLLTRNVPELWNADNKSLCDGEVCGLVWTSPKNDPKRHIQSYIRTLSPCAIERYMTFYEKSQLRVRNVHELILLFEINLSWAGKRRGGRGKDDENGDDGDDGDVSAIYEYAGAHPDADEAQKALLPQGYPAIKLKKFFVTNDPWLSEPTSTRPRLPPTFSTTTYKRMNHDLNYLSDSDLERHFAGDGKNEDRIYSSTLPLVIKGWLREELMKKIDGDGEKNKSSEESTIAILEDYLAALNRAIADNDDK